VTWLERNDPQCLDPERAADLLRGLPWGRLAVLGDSVTAGVMGPLPGYRTRSFADRLVDALAATRPAFESVTLARPSLRLAEIREQQLQPALDFRPDAVLVSAGGNDAFQEYDADDLARDVEALLVPLAEAGAVPVTIGLFDLARSGLVPPRAAEAMAHRFDELDRVTAAVSSALGGVHIDTHHHPSAADPGIYADDGIHANARGHAIAFAAIVDTLAAWSGAGLAARPAPPQAR
jgi:lysophospholipase L1-like esterase